jgi:arsenical pump membrane protein
MVSVIIISAISICLMILLIVFFPKIKIRGKEFQTFYIPPLLGAIIIIIANLVDIQTVYSSLTSTSTINPLKILILFISMTLLSVVLDELGLFKYLANFTLKKAKHNQHNIFFSLYILTSILTIFTSNDVIILTFTPFIIFFSKNAKINPIPYLVEEFITANTWSMMLLIGNPTNIYLATANGISFFNYLETMAFPTALGSIMAFGLLYLIFNKKLNEKTEPIIEDVKITDKVSLYVSLSLFVVCIILLAISSYINLEMYLICGISALTVILYLLVRSIFNKDTFIVFKNSIKRIPYTLIPFLLSMFVLVLSLDRYGVVSELANLLNNNFPILTYGLSSMLTCNLINNIPMSVLFNEIIKGVSEANRLKATYAAIIGSNIGAFITPLGALAGIMWMGSLKTYNIKYSFLDFIKYGVIVGIPTILMTLFGLYIETL